MSELTNSPIADFDWDSYEHGQVETGKTREELMKTYDESLNTVKDKEVIEGTVIALNKREAVVNIGYKSDGIIPMSEFRYNPDLKVGDTVEVFIENQEDKKGQLILSHKKARAARSWDRVNEALENNEIIKGYIKCRTKGGMIVDVFGIEAFLPGSQIDVKPIRDYDVFVGKTMEFKVVKINQEFKNVVVSHKALIEAELEQQKKEIIAKLEKGQVLEGTVKNITSYGVFIDLGGVDGLIHITDLSWGRVNDPNEVVKLDEKLNVVILDFDDEKKRIALGLKQLQPHPWDALDPNLKVGDKVKGKVVVMGRATLESLPGGRPLPERTNIVLTSDTSFGKEGCIIVHSMEELMTECAKYAPDDVMIIGGEQVYMQLIRQCDRLFITKIFESFDADKHLMNVDKMRSFELVWTGDVQEENGIQYQFLEYRKKEKDLSNGKSQE